MSPASTASDRWCDAHRTNPDYIVFVPSDGDTPAHDTGAVPDRPWDHGNTHFIVTTTPSGTFLATWTQAGDEFHGLDARIVTARSQDRGQTWSRPTVVEVPADDTGTTSVWSFPVVVPHSGRIWLFHHRNTGPVDFDRGMTGVLSWRVSDDDGLTWGDRHDTTIGRGAIDDPTMPSNWVPSGWQAPIVNMRGEVICPMTRWASNAYQCQFEAVTEGQSFNARHHEGWFLRFDNILTIDDPAGLVVSTWPDADHGIQVPHPRDSRLSSAMEPSIQNLSDGRMIAVLRTMTGHIWYSVSTDFGESWSTAETLRFQPDGPPVPHPSAPCPLHKLHDGRFLLFFHNNNGTAHGATGPGDGRARRPLCVSVGREIDNPGGQPIAFGRPHVLADNDYAPTAVAGQSGGMPIYGSFTEYAGDRVLWYPDNTTYLLGKRIPDSFIDDTWLPR